MDTSILRILDIPAAGLFSGTLQVLAKAITPAYRDTVLDEHIYHPKTVQDFLNDHLMINMAAQSARTDLDAIIAETDLAQATYFRIVFN